MVTYLTWQLSLTMTSACSNWWADGGAKRTSSFMEPPRPSSNTEGRSSNGGTKTVPEAAIVCGTERYRQAYYKIKTTWVSYKGQRNSPWKNNILLYITNEDFYFAFCSSQVVRQSIEKFTIILVSLPLKGLGYPLYTKNTNPGSMHITFLPHWT